MADIAVQQFATVGLDPAFTAAGAGGDTYTNAGDTYLFVTNGGGAPINVTLNAQTQCNQGFDHDTIVAVAAAETKQIGPLAAGRYNDASGKVNVTYSGVTSVTVAVVRT